MCSWPSREAPKLSHAKASQEQLTALRTKARFQNVRWSRNSRNSESLPESPRAFDTVPFSFSHRSIGKAMKFLDMLLWTPSGDASINSIPVVGCWWWWFYFPLSAFGLFFSPLHVDSLFTGERYDLARRQLLLYRNDGRGKLLVRDKSFYERY